MDTDIIELKEEIREFSKETDKIHNDFKGNVSKINAEFRSVDAIFAKHRRQKKTHRELQIQLVELQKEFEESLAEKQELESMQQLLGKTKVIVDELGKSKRKTGSYFVSMWMGKVNVRIWNEGDRYKLKTEYNRFKARWMAMFFVFPAFHILFGFNILMNQLQALFFLFYYTSLAIRENILALNGSMIESWWIYHHYWSILISLLTLFLYSDGGEEFDTNGIMGLNYFFFYQGLVMLLQNDYQRKRHYTRKALAKKSQLDPTTSEVIDEAPHARYKLLIPALYVTYFAQLAISIYFLFLSSSEHLSQIKCLQVIMMSICWFVLSIGNTSTLARVLKKKKKAN